MAEGTVGRVKAEFVGDATSLVRESAKAGKALDDFGKKASTASSQASTAVQNASKSAAQAAQTVTQTAQKVGQTVQQTSQAAQTAGAAAQKVAQATQQAASVTKSAMDKVTDSVSRANSSLKSFGDKATSVGRSMSLSVTAPLVATGATAIKVANDFEFAMSSIAGLVGIAGSEVDRMSGQVRDMAKEFGQSAPDAAKALYFVTSAGIDGATAMEVLEASLKSSAIGMGQSMVIADAVSSALNAYGSANLSAAEAADVMVAAVRRGKMEADSLADALPRVLPLASAMSVSFDEVGAAFAAMSLNGTDANEAATQIRGILSALLNPTKQAEEELTKLGLSGAGLRKTIREDGLLAGLELLTKAFGNNEEAAGIVFGNIRALTGVMSLFGSATEGTRDIFADLTDNTNEVDKAFSVMSQTGAFQVKQAMANLKDSFISLGQALVPVVVPALKAVTTMLAVVAGAFTALPGPIKAIIVGLGLLAAAAGPVLIGLGMIAKAVVNVQTAMASAAYQKFTTTMASAGPIMLGVAAAAVTVGAVLWRMNKNAEQARERQEALTDAMKAAGDPTATLVDRTKALVDEYLKLKAAAEDAAGGVSEVGAEQAFVQSQLGATAGLLVKFGGDIETVTKALRTGTDDFGEITDNLNAYSGAWSDLTNTTDNLASIKEDIYSVLEATDPLAKSLIALAESGDLTYNQFFNLVDALDKSADAFDDHREKIDADSEAFLSAAENITYFTDQLGTDAYAAILLNAQAMADAAGRTDVWTFTLETLNGQIAHNTAVQEGFLGGLADMADVLGVELPGQTRVAGKAIEDLTGRYQRLSAANQEGKVSLEQFLADLGLLDSALSNKLVLAFDEAISKNESLVGSFSDGSGSSRALEMAYREQAEAIGELVYNSAQLGGGIKDVAPIIGAMVVRLGDAARAAGATDSQVAALVQSLGILDGIEAEFGIKFALNTADLDRQIASIQNTLDNLLFAAGAATGDTTSALQETLRGLQAIKEAVGQASTAPSSRGGGGGGGGKKKGPLAWVEDWLKDVETYSKALFEKDFSDKLVQMSADDIAKAFENVIEEGLRLGVQNLAGGTAAIDAMKVVSEQLQAAARQLEGSNNPLERIAGDEGLRQRFKDAVADVQRLTNAVADLKKAYADFKRIEGGGKLTAGEKLAEGLQKYDELKSTLEGLRSEYETFKKAGTLTPLESSLQTLDSLKTRLDDLQSQLKDVEAMSGGTVDPLEQERQKLDDLKKSLDNLKQSRVDYQKSVTESLGNFKFEQRGGVLGQAKRYLGKVQAFRDVIVGLRDRMFPTSIIRDVVAAGIDGGTSLGRRLLSLSDADLEELKNVQKQIQGVAAETGEVAADVLFTADVNEADAAFQRQLSLVRTTYQSAIETARQQYEAQRAITEGVYQQQIKQAEQLLAQQKTVVEALYKNAISEAKKQLAEAESVAKGLETAIGDLEDTMRDLIKEIADAVKAASTPPSSGGGSSGGGGGGWTGTPTPDGGVDFTNPGGGKVHLPPGLDFSGFGKRAMGGSVTAGKPYLVGELGAELFVPGRSGSIVPNNQLMGGSSTYNITINGGGDGQDIGRQVVKAIQQYERRNGTGWRG